MIFYLNLVMLMVVLGRLDAKKKSNPIINQYITNNNNNNSCTGTCNFGNVTNNQNNITNNQNNITNNQNNITNNNITNLFQNETDQPPCYSAWNTSVAFTAYRDGAFSAGSQNTQIPFGHVFLNHGDAFDKTTGTFKAPVKGGYSFSHSVQAHGGHGNRAHAWIEVEKPDGTKTHYAGTHADNWVISSNTVNVELDKGAIVSVYLFAGYKISGVSIAKGNTFSGHLLYVA